MTEKDFKRLPTHEECPFIRKLSIKEHKKLVEIASLKSNNKTYALNEQSEGLGITKSIKIEELVIADKKSYEGKFVKIFKVKFLASLNTYALKIFVHILENLEVNNNKIAMPIAKISVHCGIDQPRKIFEGLSELIDKEVIAKHEVQDMYYINPAIVFRGSNRKILLTHKNY